MVQVRVASWNVEGRLSYNDTKTRSKPSDIVKAIKEINADILVLVEAHSETSLSKLRASQQLYDMGYKIYNAPYQDDAKIRLDSYAPQLSLMLLSKLKVEKFEVIRLGDLRNAITAVIKSRNGQDFKIIGVHLDDRAESTRINQVADLSKIIKRSKMPIVLMGDFNSMHGKYLWPSKFLRTGLVRLLAHILLPNISLRATEMARGEAIKLLEKSTKLVDADRRHRPTTTPKMRGLEWMPSIRLIQIDHIFVSQDIKVQNFKIAADNGSDHRAIISTLQIG